MSLTVLGLTEAKYCEFCQGCCVGLKVWGIKGANIVGQSLLNLVRAFAHQTRLFIKIFKQKFNLSFNFYKIIINYLKLFTNFILKQLLTFKIMYNLITEKMIKFIKI